MSQIRCVYSQEPNFPATDQHPDAVRYIVAGYLVDAIGGEPTEAEVLAFLNPEPTPQQKIAKMEREGIPEQKIDGGYVRGVREYMLGMAQIVVALGGPDVMVTPGMQKVKKLDDAIKAQRALIQ